ncbi:hypothetical protein FS837_004363 [Tulasnella sp. UAMH 9824]|nr:hypothetical protein FS837_004363 [Tulasnella sp. UAMH 9824]
MPAQFLLSGNLWEAPATREVVILKATKARSSPVRAADPGQATLESDMKVLKSIAEEWHHC